MSDEMWICIVCFLCFLNGFVAGCIYDYQKKYWRRDREEEE